MANKRSHQTDLFARQAGFVAIIITISIYALNIVTIRYSVTHGLEVNDLAGLRYLVSGIVFLIYLSFFGFKKLDDIRWKQAIIITILAGSPYMLVLMYSLSIAPVAHAGVLNQGIVPMVVIIVSSFYALIKLSLRIVLLLLAIVVGLIMVTRASFSLNSQLLFADTLLFLTGVSWGLFIFLSRMWKLKPLESSMVISLLSMIYLPFYFIFTFDGFGQASLLHIITQALFQGIIMSIVSVYLLIYAIHNLSDSLAALFSPLVPILATLLGVPILGELPDVITWTGVVIVTLAMYLLARMMAEDKR